MVQNPYQPYSPYQQAQYMPYQGTYTYPTQPIQSQMPAYGSQTTNTGIQKPPAMSGRVVSQEADITPQEVPMDGSFSWFPIADGSAVIGKRWNSDGTIQTVRYAPESTEPQHTVETVPSYVSDISSRLDRIEGILTQRARRTGLVDDRPGYMPMSMVPSERMRYDQRDMDEEYDPRYGRTFNDYRRAKRHYTETHSDSDRQKMRDKTNEHVMETMATMREMFDDADPELKKRMKADMVKLTQEMSV